VDELKLKTGVCVSPKIVGIMLNSRGCSSREDSASLSSLMKEKKFTPENIEETVLNTLRVHNKNLV
jgi:hypothetical protein